MAVQFIPHLLLLLGISRPRQREQQGAKAISLRDMQREIDNR
jgi:hypothetical protein